MRESEGVSEMKRETGVKLWEESDVPLERSPGAQ